MIDNNFFCYKLFYEKERTCHKHASKKPHKDTAFIRKGKTNTRKNATAHRKRQKHRQNIPFAKSKFQTHPTITASEQRLSTHRIKLSHPSHQNRPHCTPKSMSPTSASRSPRHRPTDVPDTDFEAVKTATPINMTLNTISTGNKKRPRKNRILLGRFYYKRTKSFQFIAAQRCWCTAS